MRPGEVIQVIAINRATGYIGTQDIVTQPSGATLNLPTPIEMGPPNLKIIATREFIDNNELTGSKDKIVNLIGNEGAGLTSDTYIKIQSIWLDQNGDTLPDDLPGYTGRLAISKGGQTQARNPDIAANFPINPGYDTKLVKLNNAADLELQHFYLQVVGGNINDRPTFESPGAGSGKLQTRPKKYVPLLVPIFDEPSTRSAEEALAIARIEKVGDLPDEVEPVYRWAYRPEMQFSVYELSKQELFYQDQDLNTQSIDLTQENASEIVGSILSGDIEFVDLIYNLEGPNNNALETFGPNHEVIFNIGAEEALATVTAGGVVRFDNPAHLDLLAVDDYLTIGLYQNNDSANVLWEFAFELVRLVADMNHDGQIIRRIIEEGQVSDAIDTEERPFLFWINDDDDDGEINEGKGAGGDIPEDGSPDHGNDKIDGMRDLVDFFPVFVAVKSTLEAFPKDDYTYRLLHENEALKFIEADGLIPITEKDEQEKSVYAPIKHVGKAQELAEKDVTLITSAGVNLTDPFLDNIKDEKGGIILVEALKDTEAPLFLEIVKKSDDKVVATAKLNLKIGHGEDMFRRVDLKDSEIDRSPSNDVAFEETTTDPGNNPDERTEPNYFVWVHGYNVSPTNARGWTSEMFKRFYRMGFNGRFIGVNWNGDTGVDYHAAIFNALQTSRSLAEELAPAMTESGPITIAAHSAGNMVAASAIAHGGLNVENYFAINSVVPIEALDRRQTHGQDRAGNPIEMSPKMTEEDWYGYPEELLVWNWHKLFGSDDERSRITWGDYFEDVDDFTYNFYSPGDEVVENAGDNESVSAGVFDTVRNWANGGSLGQHAWVIQEVGKGCNGLIAWILFECSGGWGFNNNPDDLRFIGEETPAPDDELYQRYNTAEEATTAWANGDLTSEELAQYGFFRRFSHFDEKESEYRYLYQPIDTPVVLQQASHQWELLASAIPSRSFAAAANSLEKLEDRDANFNMEDLRRGGWPQERDGFFGDRWLHSDIKNIGMPYIYPIYEEMLKIGNFVDEN